MKIFALLTLVLAFGIAVPAPAKDAGFPKAKPAIAIAVPDGWKTRYEDGRLYVTTEDELTVVVEVSALKATKQEGAKALEEMKEEVNAAFKNVTFQPMQEGGSGNVGLYILNGKGEDEHGKVNINAIMVTDGEDDHLHFVFIAASPKGSKQYGEEIATILRSIRKVE